MVLREVVASLPAIVAVEFALNEPQIEQALGCVSAPTAFLIVSAMAFGSLSCPSRMRRTRLSRLRRPLGLPRRSG